MSPAKGSSAGEMLYTGAALNDRMKGVRSIRRDGLGHASTDGDSWAS